MIVKNIMLLGLYVFMETTNNFDHYIVSLQQYEFLL